MLDCSNFLSINQTPNIFLQGLLSIQVVQQYIHVYRNHYRCNFEEVACRPFTPYVKCRHDPSLSLRVMYLKATTMLPTTFRRGLLAQLSSRQIRNFSAAKSTGAKETYEKATDSTPEPITSHSGSQTYVVSEPDPQDQPYKVPR
jgi:hypothetical protein